MRSTRSLAVAVGLCLLVAGTESRAATIGASGNSAPRPTVTPVEHGGPASVVVGGLESTVPAGSAAAPPPAASVPPPPRPSGTGTTTLPPGTDPGVGAARGNTTISVARPSGGCGPYSDGVATRACHVDAAYKNVLGRSGSPAEIAEWVLKDLDEAELVPALVATEETDGRIRGLFRACMSREPAPGELAARMGSLRSGTTLWDIAGDIAAAQTAGSPCRIDPAVERFAYLSTPGRPVDAPRTASTPANRSVS